MIDDIDFNMNSENCKTMRFLLSSFMRTNLLITLIDTSSRLCSLRKLLGKSSATILHGVNELISYNLVVKESKYYCLSSKGFIYGLALDKLCKNLYIFQSNPDFWQNHCIDGLPREFVENAYLIKDSVYRCSDKRDMEKPVTDFFDNIKNSKNIRIILPVFSDIYLEMILKTVKGNRDLELIVDEKVFNSIKKSKYYRKILRLSKKNKIVIRKYIGDLDLFLTFSDEFMSVNLFDKSGSFDDSETIFNNTSDGVKWAEIIFGYYLDNSSVVVL